jgi:APA family basic amino acid/polyamine antiporter
MPALVFISAILFGLAVTGAFEFLMRFMMTVAFAVDLMVLGGIFVLRRRRPDLARPLRVPFYPWLPGITLLLYLLVLVTIAVTQAELALGAGAMVGALWATGWWVARASHTPSGEAR